MSERVKITSVEVKMCVSCLAQLTLQRKHIRIADVNWHAKAERWGSWSFRSALMLSSWLVSASWGGSAINAVPSTSGRASCSISPACSERSCSRRLPKHLALTNYWAWVRLCAPQKCMLVPDIIAIFELLKPAKLNHSNKNSLLNQSLIS